MKNDADIEQFQYSQIQNYPYERWFREVRYSGKTLTETERKEFLAASEKVIASYSRGLPLITSQLERSKELHDEYHEIYRTLLSVMLFTLLIVIDCIVACKLFMMADKDYDRRFTRGKMKIILNEGFKKLYGFDEKTHKKSEWNRLATILKYFPEKIQKQYQELSSLLEEQSKSSSWWKDERDLETHLDADKLYASRCEDVIESKVMTDSIKLINALFAGYAFLTNMNACVFNFLLETYRRGELREE